MLRMRSFRNKTIWGTRVDLILVRNGNTPVERRLHMVRLHRQIIDLFRSA